MKKVEIYEDYREKLVLKIYSKSLGSSATYLRDEEVYDFLTKVANEPIQDVITHGSNGVVTSADIITNKHDITLDNLYRLEKHEKLLKPITEKIENELTDEKIKEIKKNRTTNTSPKVTRKNKYTNMVMDAGLLICGVATIAKLVSGGDTVTLEKHNTETIEEVHVEDNNNWFGFDAAKSGFEIKEPEIETIETNNEYNEINFNVEENQPNNYDVTTMQFEYEDRANTDKAIYVRENYGELINKYANMYGVDANLMMAIATQEKGYHSSVMDSGGATGLMQIQNDVWLGKNISAYNYETGKRDVFTVDENMIKNLETNVKLGCMYFQNCLDYFNHNIPAAIQCYNMGYQNVNNIMDKYAESQGTTRSAIISNPIDNGWMNYRYLSTDGDQCYVENVASWLGNDKIVSVLNGNNSTIDLKIQNNEVVKKF